VKTFLRTGLPPVVFAVFAVLLPAAVFADEKILPNTRANDNPKFKDGVDFEYKGKRYSWKDKLKGTGDNLGPEENYMPRVTNYDKARSYLGQWFFMDEDGDKFIDDPHFITKQQIAAAQTFVKTHQLSGFATGLPQINEAGESYQSYIKDGYVRNVYNTETEKVEDIITNKEAFTKTYEELLDKKFTELIPRNNRSFAKETNWFYSDNVPDDFPDTFWASITIEGRVMKVVIANGTSRRLAAAYYCTPGFKREYPNAVWSWKAEDGAVTSMFSKEIREDLRSSSVMEFTVK